MLPLSSPTTCLEALPLFRQAHFDAMRRAAASRRHSTMRKAHSPGVISFLNNHLHADIPQPEYFIPPVPDALKEQYSAGASALLAEQEQHLTAAGVFDPDMSWMPANVSWLPLCDVMANPPSDASYCGRMQGSVLSQAAPLKLCSMPLTSSRTRGLKPTTPPMGYYSGRICIPCLTSVLLLLTQKPCAS